MSEEIAVVSSSALSAPLLSLSMALNALSIVLVSSPAAEKAVATIVSVHSIEETVEVHVVEGG